MEIIIQLKAQLTFLDQISIHWITHPRPIRSICVVDESAHHFGGSVPSIQTVVGVRIGLVYTLRTSQSEGIGLVRIVVVVPVTIQAPTTVVIAIVVGGEGVVAVGVGVHSVQAVVVERGVGPNVRVGRLWIWHGRKGSPTVEKWFVDWRVVVMIQIVLHHAIGIVEVRVPVDLIDHVAIGVHFDHCSNGLIVLADWIIHQLRFVCSRGVGAAI